MTPEERKECDTLFMRGEEQAKTDVAFVKERFGGETGKIAAEMLREEWAYTQTLEDIVQHVVFSMQLPLSGDPWGRGYVAALKILAGKNDPPGAGSSPTSPTSPSFGSVPSLFILGG